MSFINYSSREINCKIVYFGPGKSGKTTNLVHIYNTSNPSSRGKLINPSDEDNRTLFFDFLPMDLGELKGFRTRFHLYTIPGQTMHESSRKLLLKGVDGIIFVADSQKERIKANQNSLESLSEYLSEYGYKIKKIPLVFQYNKKDLPSALPNNDLSDTLNFFSKPEVDAVAIKGTGVYESLISVSKLVLDELKGRNV